MIGEDLGTEDYDEFANAVASNEEDEESEDYYKQRGRIGYK